MARVAGCCAFSTTQNNFFWPNSPSRPQRSARPRRDLCGSFAIRPILAQAARAGGQRKMPKFRYVLA
jgi:hypothetical protein